MIYSDLLGLQRSSLSEVTCINQHVIDEIIQFTRLHNGAGRLFLRYTKSPFDGCVTGFSAHHSFQNPYSDSYDEALRIMRSHDSEDAYFVLRHLAWNTASDYQQSRLYQHHLQQPHHTDTCYMYRNQDIAHWHLFLAEKYHHADSDSQKHCDMVQNAERIVGMLNARYIASIKQTAEFFDKIWLFIVLSATL